MHYWKTAFLTLLIFGLGGVAGGLISATVIKSKIERVSHTTPGREAAGPEWIPQSVGVMHRQMNLTPDQVERVREIMMRTQREIVRARDEFRLRSRNAVERADEAIMEILSDEQKIQFEEFKKKRRALFQNQPRPQNGMPPRPGDRPGDRPMDRFGERPGSGQRPALRPADRPPLPNNRPPGPPPAQPPPAQP